MSWGGSSELILSCFPYRKRPAAFPSVGVQTSRSGPSYLGDPGGTNGSRTVEPSPQTYGAARAASGTGNPRQVTVVVQWRGLRHKASRTPSERHELARR